MLNQIRTTPWGALITGAAGLIVFFSFALAIAVGSPTIAVNAYLQLIHFSALMLSFIGAIHWGLAIGAQERGVTVPVWWYQASALPMTLGWLTLVLVSPTAKILLLSLGFLIAFMLDVSVTARHIAPLWHKNFRKFMTISVLIALAIALWAVRMSIANNTSL